ncbi:MAG: hypothetical protein ACRDVE_14395 [Actinocrinis sp.]
MSPRPHRGAALSAATTAVLLFGGCAPSPPSEPAARFEANGVAVSVTLLSLPGGEREIQATFRPQRTGFHLYSIDLPPGGVDGLGIPTRLAMRGDLRASGSPTADVTARILHIAALKVDLPVYPDGPVTITLPVDQTGSQHADVIVDYGTCSDNQCLAPVTDQVIPLELD